MSDGNLRDALDLAWSAVRERKVSQALQHLKTIQSEIYSLPKGPLPAEYTLVYACALAVTGDGGTESAFSDAERLIVPLTDSQKLQLGMHEEFGKFLAKKRAFTLARTQLTEALRIAQCLDRLEDVAELQVRLIGLDLEKSKGLLLKAFRNLEEAAGSGCSPRDKFDVWCDYVDDCNGSSKGRIAARKGGDASVDYFRTRLDAKKRRER
jgi:hypothetical protein